MFVDYVEFGRRIAKRRKELGFKQYEVNEKAGLSDKYLSSIETARSIPSIDVMMRICEALDITPNYLLLGAQDPEESDPIKLLADKARSLSPKKLSLLLSYIDWINSQDID
ncbi:helix-turn-helix transcriptional regulator [Anaerolentibacter hominis]|uniref:helix-turn-helix domain-containing protein n=1 Tax=Anaerolentibacter hominis TaxID=3079009 RepID=UPI0031B85393